MGGSSGGGWGRLGDIRSLEEKAKASLKEGKRNVFISFAAEDLAEVNLLRGQAKNENNDIEFNDYSVQEPYDSSRAEYIKQRLTERINMASTTVVYVSPHTANSRWVEWEVEKSIELGKRVVAVHKGGTPPAQLPRWVNKHKLPVVRWADLANSL